MKRPPGGRRGGRMRLDSPRAMVQSRRVMQEAIPPFRLSPGLVFVTGLSGVFVFSAFYPGAMSPDSLQQWSESITKQYTDWHPAIYAIVLRALRKLWDSPAVMLTWNVWTFSIGSLLAAEVARQRVGRIAYAIPIFIFLPFVLNNVGVLWKDVALGVSWWAASGIALYAWHAGQQAHSRAVHIGIHALMAYAYVLFGFGLLVRHNSLPAAPFLLGALLLLHLRAIGNDTRLRYIAATAVVVSLLGLLGGNFLINHLYNVRRTHIFTEVITYDLAGITRNTGRNAFPVEFSDEQLKRVRDCYRTETYRNFAPLDRRPCGFVGQAMRADDLRGSTKLYLHWLGAIASNPLAYLQHRGAVFLDFLRVGQARTSQNPASRNLCEQFRAQPSRSPALSGV